MASLWARLTAAVPAWGWLLLGTCYAVVCWANIVTRTQWISDSRLYLAWSYRYLGYSQAESAHRTHDFLVNMDGVRPCDTLCWPAGYEHGFFSGANGAVVGARPLYPLLSSPFVGLFGPYGMLVVPVVSFGVAIALMALLAHRLWGRHWGLLAGLLLLIPGTVSRFAVYAMTEALAVVLTLACVLFLPLARVPKRRDLLWFGVTLVLGLCVRQFGIALTAGVVLAWLVVAARERRWANVWWRFALVAVGVTAATLAAQSVVTRIWFGGAALDLSGRYQQLTCHALHHCGIASLPWGLRYIARADYGTLRGDLALLAIVVLAVVAVLWRRRSELTALTAGAALATVVLNLLVVWPSYYRYFVPIQPLVLLAGLALVADFAARPRRSPSRSAEAAPVPAGGVQPRPAGMPWPAGVPRPAVADRPAGVPKPGMTDRPASLPRAGATGRPAVSMAAWVLVGLTFLGAVLVVWRREKPSGGVLIALSFVLLTVAFVQLVVMVADRFGASAGVLAGLTLALSGAMVGAALDSWRRAVVLAAATVLLALLPTRDGPADRTGLRRLAGIAAVIALAGAVSVEGLALAAGPIAGWLAAAAVLRRPVNAWAPPAATAAVVGAVILGVREAAGDLTWRPWSVNHLASADFRAIAHDRVLYLALFVAIAALAIHWRSASTWYALGVAVVAGLIHAGRPASSAAWLLVVYPALLLAVAGVLAPMMAAGRSEVAPARPAVETALRGDG
jgi:hypothetical protein